MVCKDHHSQLMLKPTYKLIHLHHDKAPALKGPLINSCHGILSYGTKLPGSTLKIFEIAGYYMRFSPRTGEDFSLQPFEAPLK